jgi:hypothetical protein
MGMIKGVLIRYTVINCRFAYGSTESYYSFYLVGMKNEFRINKRSKSGMFFIKNIGKLMNDSIEFTCDTSGHNVYFYKTFIDTV